MNGTQVRNGVNGNSNGTGNGVCNGNGASPLSDDLSNGHNFTGPLPPNRMGTMGKLFHVMGTKDTDLTNKVTVVGTGQVGMAAAFALLTQNITNNICLVDVDSAKVKAEQMDLQHGAAFLRNANITAGTDYSVTAGSAICLVTAGVRQKPGESRLDLVQRNTDVMKMIIPQLMKYSPNTILVIASNPVDVLTYAAWRISGLPKSRVIGSGCNLDTARFRYLLAEKLGVAPTSVQGYIIGEHGDSSVPVWSGVNIAGVRLSEVDPAISTEDDPENFNDVHTQVVQSAYHIIKAKGYTSWAIGLSLAQICEKILLNTSCILAVTTSLKGQFGIKNDVFLSLPCVVGRNGITESIRMPLSSTELEKLKKSATMMNEIQDEIKF